MADVSGTGGTSIDFDDLESRAGFFATRAAREGRPQQVTFLPEPERRPRRCTLISVDDHLVEPPHLFEGRVPADVRRARARSVEVDDEGMEYWLYDGNAPLQGRAQRGRRSPDGELSFEPTRFDEMRRGAWDIDARVHDMDLNGVYASLNFPSSLAGFAGQRYQLGRQRPRARARRRARAWNDWHLEEWAGTHPGPHHPVPAAVAARPELAAAEVRRNAARGFHAVTFPELPERLGLPSLHTGYWDPFMAACEETGTVVCLHVGSSSTRPDDRRPTRRPTPSACCSSAGRCSPPSTGCTRGIPVRFPT